MTALRLSLIFFALLLGAFFLGASGNAEGQAASGTTIAKILTNSSLWGKDFPAFLLRIPSWNETHESKVLVFKDRVISNTPYETRARADEAAAKLTAALGMTPMSPAREFRSMLEGVRQIPFRVEVTPYADDSLRVVLIDSSIQLLSADLTPASLKDRLGEPERVRKVVLQGKGDSRGVVLTLYEYASGKVVFAQADLSTRPGLIDRVFIDVPAATAAVFRGE